MFSSSLRTVSRRASRFVVASSRSTTAVARRSLSTGGQQLEALTAKYPHMDVVKYEHKNRVWSLQHVHYYSEALAIGLMETGLKSGDVVLSWLPSHFSEQVCEGKVMTSIYSRFPDKPSLFFL